MRTPGRCTNTEGCWISASHRNVWLSVGEEFLCPNCNGMLSPPLPQARSLRMVKRVAALSAVASFGLVVLGAGAVELSHLSWPGQAVAARVVQAPAALVASTFTTTHDARRTNTEAPERATALSPSGERLALGEIAKAGPNSLISMELASNSTSSPKMKHTGPLLWFKSHGERAGSPASDTGASDEQIVDAGEAHAGPVTQVSAAVLAPGASMERPVVMPISFGAPVGPETDGEPVSMSWHHHGVVAVRASHFLPAAPVSAPASPDAIAQICRIPSLMH